MCVTSVAHTFFILGGGEMDYNLWINKAVMKIGALEKGKEFTLKNLFSGIEWDELKTGEKRSFGRYFKNEVKDKKIPDVVITEETKISTYKKTK